MLSHLPSLTRLHRHTRNLRVFLVKMQRNGEVSLAHWVSPIHERTTSCAGLSLSLFLRLHTILVEPLADAYLPSVSGLFLSFFFLGDASNSYHRAGTHHHHHHRHLPFLMSDFEVVSSEDEEAGIITVGRSAEVPPYGHLRPFCRGKLLWSPEASHWILLLLTLAGGTLLFTVLWGSLRYTSPRIQLNWWMTQLPVIIVALLAVVSATLLLCTSLTNPGILPKNSVPPSLSGSSAKDYCTTLSYCMTCHIYRPSQSVHCRRCNNCVAVFDRHCRLLGCCIGELNRRYFLLFLFSTFTCSLFISACLGYFVIVVPPKENLVLYVFFTVGLAITIPLNLVLAGYLLHNLRLIRMGLLHREYMNGAPQRSRGRVSFFANLMLVFFPRKECG
ncbi:hypothetical protein, unknown function [Leishmania tarentolae]|uniref:Palmitoyltransferase n=1 Tax=Leishmania tarentolae TaxID=5689 RepID=A0A640KBI2_LEITA|nr:hypothetical protein, unknown function [Leishmania tarentolae]